MKIVIRKNKKSIDRLISNHLVKSIAGKDHFVLGLATGSTPLGVYQNLIEKYQQGKVSFAKVTTFNLDEYAKLPPIHPQSYRYFMNENLFNHIDIDLQQTHVPASTLENGEEYDLLIAKNGGIDIQILGIGANGHIAFNEPGTAFDSLTHLTDLSLKTRVDNARFFEHFEDVPQQAITMGLASIMNAKEIILIATGENKADAVKEMVRGECSPSCPASILQRHQNVTIYVDEQAASKILP